MDEYTVGTVSASYDRQGIYSDESRKPRSDKAEQWKELATLFEDVVHELNQPVGEIGLSLGIALKYLEKGDIEGAKKSLGKLSGAVKSLGDRMGVYKALTQRGSAEDTHRLADIADGVEKLLKPLADKLQVRIDIEIHDDNKYQKPLYLKGDGFLFQMAIRALLHNAIQAYAGSSISPEMRRVIIRGIYTPSHTKDTPYGWADIYVRDMGTGISSDVRQKIFERGFTTKKERGLGLGLSLAQSVAEHYGGWLRLIDEVSPGAEFWLRFPAAPAPENTERREI